MSAVGRGAAAGAAALAALGATVAVVAPGTTAGVAVGRLFAAGGTAVVAAWFARERDGPAGFASVVAALLGVAAAAVGVAAGGGGVVTRAAASTGFVATGIALLAVGVAAPDPRLPPVGQRTAAVVGLCAVGGALLSPLRPIALVGWAGWAAWLALHFVVRVTR